MPSEYPRKPIGNFFIKKDLQVRLILKIVFSSLIATIVFAATLLLTYQFSFRDAAFYQVTLGTSEPEIGDRLDIVSIIFPSLLISVVVNVVISGCIGLYSSRKYAVPIYKLEKWASLLMEGKLTALLYFRAKDEMKELSDKCNQCTENIRTWFMQIKKQVEEIEEKDKSGPVRKIGETLEKIELESETIEVHTDEFKVPGT